MYQQRKILTATVSGFKSLSFYTEKAGWH